MDAYLYNVYLSCLIISTSISYDVVTSPSISSGVVNSFTSFVYFIRRLIDLTTRHRAETEMETERLRSAQNQAEKALESRERSHKQRVRGLEGQVATLKDQLGQEMKKRQQYIRYVGPV